MQTIYYLSHNELPFYIGKTKYPLFHRLVEHIINSKNNHASNPEKNAIIKSINFDVQINEIETVNGEKASLSSIEEYWMWQFKSWGFPIINHQTSPSRKAITNKPQIPIKIEQGIPAPKIRERYPWAELCVGDSFLINQSQRSGVHPSLRDYNTLHKTTIKITTKKLGEDQYRCWRVE